MNMHKLPIHPWMETFRGYRLDGHPFDAEQSAYESEEEDDLIILLL